MKIKFYFSLILLSTFFSICEKTNAQSPDWLWAKGMGGAGGNGKSTSIEVAGNRDVYTTGFFQGTVDFDPGGGLFNLTSAGNNDIFISKLDSAGNFVWAKAMGGTGAVSGSSIVVDDSDNVYTTGFFSGTVDFDPDTSVGSVFNLTSAGLSDIFICKLDSSGNFVWAKAMGGTGSGSGLSIALDASGNVYTTGYFSGTVDFDPDSSGTFNLTLAVLNDIFISKLNASGNFVWAKRMGGSYSDHGCSIVLDASGNVYSTGFFGGTVDFDPDTSAGNVFNLTSAGNSDIFISKLDSAGIFIWAKAMSGFGSIRGYAIAFDASGNVYTTGSFSGTVDFDPGLGNFNLTSDGSNADIFISKLDSSGNFVWAKAMGGIEQDESHSIAIDASGNVYTTGFFGTTVDFNPGPGTFNITTVGFYDIFISKLDSAGNFIWAKAVGGTGLYDEGTSIALDVTGNVDVTGYFNSPAIAFGTTTLTNAGAGSNNIFIAKLDTVLVSGNNDVSSSLNMTSIYPNPGSNHFTITLAGTNKKVEVTITDIAGKVIYTTTETEKQKIEVNTKDFEEGVYLVRIQATDFIETKKLIVEK